MKNNRLTDQEKIDIINEYSFGNISCNKLAKKFNKHPSSIVRLLKRRDVKINNNLSEINRKYSLDETFFDEINTEEKAYFLGLLYADGYNEPKRNTSQIHLQEEDKEIIERFALAIKTNRPLITKKFTNKKLKTLVGISIYNENISRSLSKLGCVAKKSLILEFPTEKQVPYYLIRHFIRGFFDGDGSVYRSKNVNRNAYFNFTSTFMFCYKLYKIIKKECGIDMIFDKIRKNGISATIHKSGVNNVVKFLDWLYKDANIFMNRKYQKYLEIKEIKYIYKVS